MKKFNALAYMPHMLPSRRLKSTLEDECPPLLAATPHGAALEWFWRLPPVTRKSVERIIVWSGPANPLFEPYRGETVAYQQVNGLLVEIERFAPEPVFQIAFVRPEAAAMSDDTFWDPIAKSA